MGQDVLSSQENIKFKLSSKHDNDNKLELIFERNSEKSTYISVK